MDGPTVALNYDLNNTEQFPDFGNFHTRVSNSKRRRLIDKRPRVNGDSAFAGWPTSRPQEAPSASSSTYLDNSAMDMQYSDLDPSSVTSSRNGSDANSAAATMIAMGHSSTAQQTASLFNTTTTSSATSSPPTQSQWNAATTYADTGSMVYSEVSSFHSQPYFYDHAEPMPSFTNPWPSATAQTGLYGMDTSSMSGVMSRDDDFYTLARSHHGSLSYSDEHQPHAMRYVSPAPNIYSSVVDSYGLPMGSSQDHDAADLAGADTRLHHLQSLDSLSTQLIHTIARYTHSQLQEMIKDKTAEEHHEYFTLKGLFDRTRKVFASDGHLIGPSIIRSCQPQHQEILRKANITTYITAILQSHDVNFFHLNHFFLETFVPLGHRLLKWQGAVLLELKTQTYISALQNSGRTPQELMDKIFPYDLDSMILQRHPDGPSLSPSEQDFLDRARSRRQYLLAEPTGEEVSTSLQRRYQWNDFAREFAAAISKNIDGLLNTPSKLQPYNLSRNRSGSAHVLGSSSQSVDTLPKVVSSSSTGARSSSSTEPKRTMSMGSVVRQPWTKPEEQALLEGLSRVNGPHWSQILALYGRGGSVSEVLKDRNQVQLKDKARNLKLWHLKTGREVPPSLRGVTGELRKRGGARARAALEAAEEQQSRRKSGSNDDDAYGENDNHPVR